MERKLTGTMMGVERGGGGHYGKQDVRSIVGGGMRYVRLDSVG